MLAYAEYKVDKHEWKINHPNATSEQLQAFLDHYTDRVLEKYVKESANVLLAYAGEYAEQILPEQIEKIKNDYFLEQLDNAKKDINQGVNQSKTKFGMAIWQNLVASALFTFILFVLALMIRFAAPNTNVGKLLQYLFASDKYEIHLIEKKD